MDDINLDDINHDDNLSIETSFGESANSHNHSDEEEYDSDSEVNNSFESDDDLQGCCHRSKQQQHS